MKLPPLPGHRLEVVGEKEPRGDATDFVFVRRLEMRARFANGTASAPFEYFAAMRSRLDAVVVVAHHRNEHGEQMVVLRSALRPLDAMRPMSARPMREKESLGELWEVPAGLVEKEEQTPEGLLACARRELFEETGYEVAASSFKPLGHPTFPCPGVIGERHFFFHVEVDPRARKTPSEDGSAVEQFALVESIPLKEALEACSRGEIEDAKTELALFRLRAL